MFYYGLGNGSSGDSGWGLQSGLGESSNQGDPGELNGHPWNTFALSNDEIPPNLPTEDMFDTALGSGTLGRPVDWFLALQGDFPVSMATPTLGMAPASPSTAFELGTTFRSMTSGITTSLSASPQTAPLSLSTDAFPPAGKLLGKEPMFGPQASSVFHTSVSSPLAQGDQLSSLNESIKRGWTGAALRASMQKCPGCDKRFSRPDSLKRHLVEQKHGTGDRRVTKSRADASLKDHLCPTPRCARSKPGAGFKRATHLQGHLKSRCKVDGLFLAERVMAVSPRPVADGQSNNGDGLVPPEGSSSGSDSAPRYDEVAAQESTVEFDRAETDASDAAPRDDDLVSTLERRYRAEEEELRCLEERWELERRRRRERLDSLKGVMEMYKDGNTSSV